MAHVDATRLVEYALELGAYIGFVLIFAIIVAAGWIAVVGDGMAETISGLWVGAGTFALGMVALQYKIIHDAVEDAMQPNTQ